MQDLHVGSPGQPCMHGRGGVLLSRLLVHTAGTVFLGVLEHFCTAFFLYMLVLPETKRVVMVICKLSTF